MNEASPPPRFRRTVDGRWIAGVCAGLARHFGWNLPLVRLGFAAATLMTGVLPGLATYVLAWMFVPLAPAAPGRGYGLHRSATDRKIAGVCGGLAESWGLDPALLRLFAVFATLATGILIGAFAYFVAWFVLPVGETSSPRRDGAGAVLGV